MKVIIADTSCLIIYHKIGQFEILHGTFPDLIVTKEVAEEFGELPNWVTTQEVTDNGQYLKWAEDLRKGEASSIALALEFDNSLLIIDEKKGRKVAKELRIEIIGSLGILIKAKEKGVIKSVREILTLIDKTDFRVSQSVREKVLKESGELD
jgi:predicted nucleic acid-binding protein